MKPSRRCPECKGPILKKDAPIYKGREYCCADCALKAWEKDE